MAEGGCSASAGERKRPRRAPRDEAERGKGGTRGEREKDVEKGGRCCCWSDAILSLMFPRTGDGASSALLSKP